MNSSEKEKLRYWFGMRLVVIVILEGSNMNLQQLLLFIFILKFVYYCSSCRSTMQEQNIEWTRFVVYGTLLLNFTTSRFYSLSGNAS